MPKWYDSISESDQRFMLDQPVFFVASAPLAGKYVNVSPKGHPSRTFAILGPNQVAYLDFTASASETISHIYENGRITMMFTSFLESPRIVRLFARGRVIERDDPAFRPTVQKMAEAGMKLERPEERTRERIQRELERREAGVDEEGNKKFRPGDVDMRASDGSGLIGIRAVIVLDVWRVQSSCGYGVPLLMAGPDGTLVEGPKKDKRINACEETVSNHEAETLPHDEEKGRSQNIYHPISVQFDKSWDDRILLEKWQRKMVTSGKIEHFRKAHSTLSHDGLPGLKMCCDSSDHRRTLEFNAWVRRIFIGQWSAVLVGMLLALVLRAMFRLFQVVVA